MVSALGGGARDLELKRPPTDSTFRYLFLQADVAEICRQLQVWMLAQMSGDSENWTSALHH